MTGIKTGREPAPGQPAGKEMDRDEPVKREISAFYDRQVRDGPAGPVYGMGSSGIDRD